MYRRCTGNTAKCRKCAWVDDGRGGYPLYPSRNGTACVPVRQRQRPAWTDRTCMSLGLRFLSAPVSRGAPHAAVRGAACAALPSTASCTGPCPPPAHVPACVPESRSAPFLTPWSAHWGPGAAVPLAALNVSAWLVARACHARSGGASRCAVCCWRRDVTLLSVH